MWIGPQAPTADEVRAREAKGLPLIAWFQSSPESGIATQDLQVNDWDDNEPFVEIVEYAQTIRVDEEVGEWLGWCATPDEVRALSAPAPTNGPDPNGCERCGKPLATEEQRAVVRQLYWDAPTCTEGVAAEKTARDPRLCYNLAPGDEECAPFDWRALYFAGRAPAVAPDVAAMARGDDDQPPAEQIAREVIAASEIGWVSPRKVALARAVLAGAPSITAEEHATVDEAEQTAGTARIGAPARRAILGLIEIVRRLTGGGGA